MARFIGIACVRASSRARVHRERRPGCQLIGGEQPAKLAETILQIRERDTTIVMHNDGVVQGLSEVPFIQDVMGVLTIGTGLGSGAPTKSSVACVPRCCNADVAYGVVGSASYGRCPMPNSACRKVTPKGTTSPPTALLCACQSECDCKPPFSGLQQDDNGTELFKIRSRSVSRRVLSSKASADVHRFSQLQ